MTETDDEITGQPWATREELTRFEALSTGQASSPAEAANAGDHVHTPACEFCGKGLPDMGLGFMDHLDASRSCQQRWEDQRSFVLEDAGSG